MREIQKTILAIDSTVGRTSATISKCGEVFVSLVDNDELDSSVNLLSVIDDLLHKARIKITDINLFVASTGPGSYTGMRVGLSTIKAMAYSLGINCVGVPTLKALAHAAGGSEFTLSILPAGRKELFVQPFSVSPQLDVKEIEQAKCISVDGLLKVIDEISCLTFVGLGAELIVDDLADFAKSKGVMFYKTLDTDSEENTKIKEGWRLFNSFYVLSESVASLASKDNMTDEIMPQHLQAEYVRTA